MKNKLFAILSAVLVLASAVSIIFFGFGKSFDTRFSALLTVTFIVPTEESTVTAAVEKAGVTDYSVQAVTDASGYEGFMIHMTLPEGKTGEDVIATLSESMNYYSVSVQNVNQPLTLSNALTALWTVSVAGVVALVYMAVRLGLKKALAALLLVLHNAVIAVGILSVSRVGASAAGLAAILLVIGLTAVTVWMALSSKDGSKGCTIALSAAAAVAGIAGIVCGGSMLGFGVIALAGAVLNAYATLLVLPLIPVKASR